MIRIHKPRAWPEKLKTDGEAARQKMEAAYDAAPDDYKSARKKFEFDGDTYGARSVKEALKTAQAGKCAFCEAIIGHISFGDVEHFRPKGAWKQCEDDKLTYPGYYWLAYNWDNLLLACTLCNRRYKKNLFPLEDPSRRAHSHNDDLARENPMLIDPGAEDPEQHITFRGTEAVAKNNSPRGQTSIDVFGLNRDELWEDRRRHYALHKLLHALANLDLPEARNAQAQLDESTRNNAPYAAMMRAAVAQAFDPVADSP